MSPVATRVATAATMAYQPVFTSMSAPLPVLMRTWTLSTRATSRPTMTMPAASKAAATPPAQSRMASIRGPGPGLPPYGS